MCEYMHIYRHIFIFWQRLPSFHIKSMSDALTIRDESRTEKIFTRFSKERTVFQKFHRLI